MIVNYQNFDIRSIRNVEFFSLLIIFILCKMLESISVTRMIWIMIYVQSKIP